MERQVIFRDYQEQTAGDHNNLQGFARETIDDLSKDVVSKSRKYAGLVVQKTGQVEVTIAAGRVYDAGLIYSKRTSSTQSMSTYTAAAAKRIVAVSALGVENETDVQTRDYLVNVDTGEVEPRAAAMTRSRDVNIVFTSGAEAADPVAPPIPVNHVLVATILMDTVQVVSVTMQIANEVESTDDLDARSTSLEVFRSQIEPRVASLASDLAALQNELRSTVTRAAFGQLFIDVARLKESLRFPSSAVGYGADFFLDQDGSDITNAAALGYDANVEMGIRFPFANMDEFEISLFSANDPNAALINGTLLPKHTDVLKVQTGAFASELGIAQYGFQTHTVKQGYMSRSRLRYGGYYWQCTNTAHFNGPGQATGASQLYDFQTTGFTAVTDLYNAGAWLDAGTNQVYVHNSLRADTWWYDTWKEPFMYTETTNYTLTGAHIAQTFLVSNDTWAKKLGFYVTAKGANEDIHVAVCEVDTGVPNLSKAILKVTYPHASIVVGWNRIAIPPTFLQKGKRYALVLISNANHKVGMAGGQDYLDGTFFYSTDGIYYQGDLTKDLMLEVWGAKFDAAQVAIEFAPINLDGGFRNIDILAEQWVPDSTQLVFELRPNGTGEWLPLVNDNGAILASAPPLAQFRARFIGTKDMAPALRLTGSRVRVTRPKTTFKHVSDVKTLAIASSTIKVQVTYEHYDDSDGTLGSGVPHESTVRLYRSGAYQTPSAVSDVLKDADAKRHYREYTFTGTSMTSFRIVTDGVTTSPQNTFHVAETTYYSL
jgi:hypothetical protein